MTAAVAMTLQLRSLVKANGELELALDRVPIPAPGPSEVLVRVEAAPINPSDLGLLLGAADMSTARVAGAGETALVTATIPAAFMKAMAGRTGRPLPVGNEGAGVVVAAGEDAAAQALIGRTVAIFGGAMYAQYRLAEAGECLMLPEDATPMDGASCFVNPLTALAMVSAMRREGHTALVHTAAASNLGRMLNRICIADRIGLVNIVRNPGQGDILRAAGARHVCDSSVPSFIEDLTAAIQSTGATLAFDAVGGGKLAGQILACMEIAAGKSASAYSRYGSTVHKQVYIYGNLDPRPTKLSRAMGMAWGIGGWLLMPYLQTLDAAEVQAMRKRVAAELKTTFASHYTKVISLAEALRLDHIAAYNRRATGEKYLINPNLGLAPD
jgi:NADPH:quinone reductase-like Zn-dependent oxidoreductase